MEWRIGKHAKEKYFTASERKV